MKIKTQISKPFVCSFAILSMLLISVNLTIAQQCGNFFEPAYSAINKLKNPYPYTSFGMNDWTGDGKSDFWEFRTNETGSAVNVVIFPSKPTGYWDWDNPVVLSTTIPPLTNSANVIVFDVNADGRMDLVSHISNGYQVHRNNGNGSLIPLTSFSPSFNTLELVDLDGDNLPDWVHYDTASNPDRGVLVYERQNPDGSFSDKTHIVDLITGSDLYHGQKAFGDFNGDGKIDLIFTYQYNQRGYTLVKNLGNGNFEIAAPVLSQAIGVGAFVKDFNNDGKADFVNETGIFYGQADGTFTRIQLPSFNGYRSFAELNGDNFLDIISADSNSYTTLINNGTGIFTATSYPKNLRTNSDVLKFEDFNGDGRDDIFNNTRFNIPTNLFNEWLIVVQENLCQPRGATKSANFDGNDNKDVMTWNPNNGNWSSKNAVWGSGADSSSKNFQWGTGSLGDVPAPGDFDGDGKTDYAVYRNSTGVWYIYRSSDSAWQTFQFGISGDIAVPNDYDGGGKTDIAVFRPSNGSWYIWFSETQQFLGVQFGLDGDKAVPADYDGDNKTDIAVFRPSTGVWYYLKSSDGGFRAIQWGISTDKPIPADYDGDGKADLTIYRNGDWWMLRSSNNSIVSFQWGTANDIPVPVYRNSVSADLTLYNPTNNTWNYFANRYSPGIALGGSQDKPVYFGLPNN